MVWNLLIMFMFLINEIMLGINGYFVVKAILTIQKPVEEQPKRVVRKHNKIKASNYNNSFNTRGYDIYKNEKTGLYEPQKPHQGIELKKQKEE